MNFKLSLALFAASAMALNSTNGTNVPGHNGTVVPGHNGTNGGNGTARPTPTGAEVSNSGSTHLVNAGILGAVVAGGVAFML